MSDPALQWDDLRFFLALAGMATYVLMFFGVAKAIKLDLSALKGARRRSKPGAATQETNS